MRKEHVLIFYENPLFAEGLASLLRREPYLEVVEVASRSRGAWSRLRSMQPDVVIVEGRDVTRGAASVLRGLKGVAKVWIIGANLDEKDALLLIGFKLPATEPNLIKAVKAQSKITRRKSGGFLSFATEMREIFSRRRKFNSLLAGIPAGDAVA